MVHWLHSSYWWSNHHVTWNCWLHQGYQQPLGAKAFHVWSLRSWNLMVEPLTRRMVGLHGWSSLSTELMVVLQRWSCFKTSFLLAYWVLQPNWFLDSRKTRNLQSSCQRQLGSRCSSTNQLSLKQKLVLRTRCQTWGQKHLRTSWRC